MKSEGKKECIVEASSGIRYRYEGRREVLFMLCKCHVLADQTYTSSAPCC